MRRRSPRSTLFPYTTLFRSALAVRLELPALAGRGAGAGAAPLRLGGRVPPGGLRGGRRGADGPLRPPPGRARSEEHTSELQSLRHLVCRLLPEKKKYYSLTS